MADDERDVQYELKSVRVIRGTEARSIAKWEKEGWEFLSQENAPLLRSDLSFRRVKKKLPKYVLPLVGGMVVILAAVITIAALSGNGTEAIDPSPSEASEMQAEPEPQGVPVEEEARAEETTTEEPARLSDAERTARFDNDLKFALFVEDSYHELLFVDPSMWGGHIVNIRVDGDLVYVTLQVDRNTPDGRHMGEQAAQALSTLMTRETIAAVGYGWIIVEDGTGVVIDQKQPAPLL